MRLSKHHGLRNDFLIVLDEANDHPVAAGPDLARQLCDRRSGVGADGLIHGARPTDGSDVDVVMHLWNADGSRAEVSGNGIRCLAQAVLRSRAATGGTVVVATDAGDRTLVVTGGTSNQVTVRVDMGLVADGPDPSGVDLPFAAKEVASADLGNPHLVAWVDDPAAIDLAVAGPQIESAFAHGINLEVIAPGPTPGTLHLHVWERGAGITEACGTGACAAVALANRWGIADATTEVVMPGGTVVVELVDGHAILSGPSIHIADIEVAHD